MSELHSGTEEEDEEARPHPLSIEAMLQACWIRHCRAPTVAVTQDKELAWSDKNLYFVGLKIQPGLLKILHEHIACDRCNYWGKKNHMEEIIFFSPYK